MYKLSAIILATCLLSIGLTSASAESTSAPPAPRALMQQVDGRYLAAGAWCNHTAVTFSMTVTGSGVALTPEIELREAGHAFTGVPTSKGASVTVGVSKDATLTVTVKGLKNGLSYRWEARVLDGTGTPSAWTVFKTKRSARAFGVDTAAPGRPRIVSLSGIKFNSWSRNRNPTFRWSSKDGQSGIGGYAYSFGKTLHAVRRGHVRTTEGTFSNAVNGKWVLRVWAMDRAGNWSHESYYRFNIDRSAPRVRFEGALTRNFNPYSRKERWTYRLVRQADVMAAIQEPSKHWTLFREKLGHLKAGVYTYTWNGRGLKNHMVPKGSYRLLISTKDTLGNSATFASWAISVRPFKPHYPYYPRSGRHIVVSLKKEAIYAYNGTHLVRWSLATTGNPVLPTPTGHFAIFARFSPFQFVSPWPEGSPYYYAPSWVNYAMEFIGGGYFIHDAPWRTVFGPGSDGPGQPGTNYGGSHGCVNVPLPMAKFLWSWSTIGTPVDVLG